MNKDLSVFLDAVRFGAAFLVLLCHLDEFWVPGLFPFATHLGLEAVAAFFVLSGLVIGYVTDGRETELRAYGVSRAARLYSVVVPCLLLTFALDTAGRSLLPAYYDESWPTLASPACEFGKTLLSFAFVNQAWGWGPCPGSDGPFWSLCYEVTYYVLFAVVRFGRGAGRWGLAALLCLAAGPQIIGLFPIWLLGLGCYRICRDARLGPAAGRTVLAGALGIWAVCEALRWHYGIGLGRQLHYLHDTAWQMYAAALPFAGVVVGIRFAGVGVAGLARPVRWLAGATFTLYLLHFPLARLLNGLVPAGWPSGLRYAALLAGVLPAAFLVAQVTERRKRAWRNAIEAALPLAGRFGRAVLAR